MGLQKYQDRKDGLRLEGTHIIRGKERKKQERHKYKNRYTASLLSRSLDFAPGPNRS